MITNKTKRTLHICYITDVRYLQFTMSSIYSIIRRKDQDTTIVFYVVGYRLEKEHIAIINGFNRVDGIQAIAANIVDIDDPGCVWYLKLLIPDMDLFNNVNKLLYIDGDLFARRDVSSVYHTDLDGYSIGMVKDAGGVILKGIGEWPQPEYFHRDFYFNAGLILMDLDKLRKNKIYKEWMKYVVAMGKSRFGPDQWAINYVSHYDCKALPPSFQLSYHDLIRYPEMHVHRIERWNQYYNTNYSSIKEMVDASYFWHYHENKTEMARNYPLIARTFSLLFSDYDQFAQTGIVKPWEPEDDRLFYINPNTME